MSHILTLRLPKELSVWLSSEANSSGVSASKIAVNKLEVLRKRSKEEEFTKISGVAVYDPPKVLRRKRAS